MNNWKKKKLKEAGISLIDCDHKTPKESSSGLPYVAIPQIKDGYINLLEAKLISEDDFQKWTQKANPEPHDMVVSRRCNPGESAYVSEGIKFALGQNLLLLRSDGRQVYKQFLRWIVNSPAWWNEVRKYMNYGAIFNSLKCKDILEFSLLIPPIEEQKSIAAVLSCLDRKIENLRKQNETLEAIAQTLFKRWFIDFEFPYDFAQGKPSPDGQPYKSSGGTMQSSALGEIPEGWQAGKLEEIIDVNPRESIKKGAMTRYIEMKALSTSSMAITESYLREFKSGSKFRNGDTLLARITPCLENGKTAFVNILEEGEVAYGSTEFIVMRPTNKSCPEFVYSLARSAYFRDYVIKNMTGSSGRQRIPNEQVSFYKISIPNLEIMTLFHEICKPAFKKIEENQNTIRVLTKIRDNLLPKLMNGQLRITP
jgi:type I restriction enzyme S subunit